MKPMYIDAIDYIAIGCTCGEYTLSQLHPCTLALPSSFPLSHELPLSLPFPLPSLSSFPAFLLSFFLSTLWCSHSLLSLFSFKKPISMIRWHPAGSFAFVLSSRGELQAYDLALNPLLFLLASEEPSPTPILQLDSHIL